MFLRYSNKLNNLQGGENTVISAERFVKSSINIRNVTHITDDVKVSRGKLIDPYQPFFGVDGKAYRISYPDALCMNTNCYSFAMGWRVKGIKGRDYHPGFLINRRYSSIDEVLDLVQADLKACRRQVYEIIWDTAIPDQLPNDKEGHWVKALWCPERGLTSLHFMVKDPNSGRWLHKMGWEYRPKVVTRLVSYMNDKEALQKYAFGSDYSKEEMDIAMQLLFGSKGPIGVLPTEIIVEPDDNHDYLSITAENLLATYHPLWVMRIADPK